MKNKYLIRLIVFLARISVIGKRGIFRRFLIYIIRILSCEKGCMNFHINKVPFLIYFDTDFKAIFENYNIKEINFLKKNLVADGAFLDIGANYGYYTQTISFHNLVDKVISIEPNKKYIDRIKHNYSISLNQNKNVSPIFIENIAISNHKKEAFLNLESGLGSAYIQNDNSKSSIEVKCDTLENIIIKHDIKKISGLKIDVEGHEDKALAPFLENMNISYYPKLILIEYTSKISWDKDIIFLLKSKGYNEIFRTKANMALQLKI